MTSLLINVSKPYNIHIENTLTALYAKLPVNLKSSSIFIIVDKNLINNHLIELTNYLTNQNIVYHIYYLHATEKNKSLAIYNDICNWCLANGMTKSSTIIAFGGGIIGDIAGFCAATLFRGVRFIQIPTTLLSMVDSSIGGKNAVNTNISKNSIGTIYQPNSILIYPNFLSTLPKREILSGFAEVIKYACLFSSTFFDYLTQHIYLIKNSTLDNNFLQRIIIESCNFKKSIVEQDEFEEKGIRYLLNLGHTFGHALEKFNNYNENLNHGEAVAMGILLAYKLSVILNLCQKDDLIKITTLLNTLNYPKFHNMFPNISAEQILKTMQKDKKYTNNNITLILPTQIGKCIVTQDIQSPLLLNFLQQELQK